MPDPSALNNLLKWSIENTNPSTSTTSDTPGPPPTSTLDRAALAHLLGGPSDADLMREAMTAIQSPDCPLDQKLIAFDNFEQLVEQIDNANNMESLQMWSPLVGLLEAEEEALRMYAAWCMGTAVQNNVKAQERMLVVGAIPLLVKQAREDPSLAARKKAILALSSGIRNYQPALDKAVQSLPQGYSGKEGKLDATDMEAVDGVIGKLREESAQKG